MERGAAVECRGARVPRGATRRARFECRGRSAERASGAGAWRSGAGAGAQTHTDGEEVVGGGRVRGRRRRRRRCGWYWKRLRRAGRHAVLVGAPGPRLCIFQPAAADAGIAPAAVRVERPEDAAGGVLAHMTAGIHGVGAVRRELVEDVAAGVLSVRIGSTLRRRLMCGRGDEAEIAEAEAEEQGGRRRLAEHHGR